MRKYLIILLLFLSGVVSAQTYKIQQTDNINNHLRLNTKTGELFQIQNDGQRFMINDGFSLDNEIPGRYKLFKTENIWTFILLDTFTGKLWQSQFSVDGVEYIFSVPINTYKLSNSNKSKFTIEPMTSMFQFYLLDEETGEMWKFQWSTKGDEYRWIEKV